MVPDKGGEVTAKEGMVNAIRGFFINWTATIVVDSSTANSFYGGETVDTNPPSKNLDLGRKIKMPKSLPKRFIRVP